MVWWHHWLNEHEHELEQTLGETEGQGSLACCSPAVVRVRHDWLACQSWTCNCMHSMDHDLPAPASLFILTSHLSLSHMASSPSTDVLVAPHLQHAVCTSGPLHMWVSLPERSFLASLSQLPACILCEGRDSVCLVILLYPYCQHKAWLTVRHQ